MKTKACATVALVVICSCVLLGYTSASDGSAGGLLALTPRLTMTPTGDVFTSPLPSPTPTVTPTDDPFTSPLPSPAPTTTSLCLYTATPSSIPPTPTPTGSSTSAPTLTTTPPYPYTTTPTASPSLTPTRDPFTSPLPTSTPIAWHSPTPESALTPTPTPTRFCPYPTPEPLWVDPVLSPTDGLSQAIVVYAGNSEAITITTESGLFVAPDSPSTYWPVLVDVNLLPGTTHHLHVFSRVKSFEFGECVYRGYTLSTTTDRYGDPLTIVQQTGGQAAHTVWLPLVLKNQGLVIPLSPRLPVDRECLPPAECAY